MDSSDKGFAQTLAVNRTKVELKYDGWVVTFPDPKAVNRTKVELK